MKTCATAQGSGQCAVLQVTNSVNEQTRQAINRPKTQVAAGCTVRGIGDFRGNAGKGFAGTYTV
jgi:hypothetical protein